MGTSTVKQSKDLIIVSFVLEIIHIIIEELFSKQSILKNIKCPQSKKLESFGKNEGGRPSFYFRNHTPYLENNKVRVGKDSLVFSVFATP